MGVVTFVGEEEGLVIFCSVEREHVIFCRQVCFSVPPLMQNDEYSLLRGSYDNWRLFFEREMNLVFQLQDVYTQKIIFCTNANFDFAPMYKQNIYSLESKNLTPMQRYLSEVLCNAAPRTPILCRRIHDRVPLPPKTCIFVSPCLHN